MSVSSLSLEQSPITLVGDHIRTIAELEPEKPYRDAGDHLQEHRALYGASTLTAAACIGLASGVRRRAYHLLGEAQEMLTANDADQTTAREAQALASTIGLLAAWAKPSVRKSQREEAINEQRAALHHSTMGLLAHYTLALTTKAERKTEQAFDYTVFGTITELTTLGLLSRQQHPMFIATQALPHHDVGKDWRSNLDILATASRPQNKPERHQVQCKSTCLGLCSDVYFDVDEEVQARRTMQRERIAKSDPFIKEISGCCDLGIQRPYMLPRLLVKEERGLASSEEVAALNVITDRLTLEVSLPKRITPVSEPIRFRPSAKTRREARQEKAKQRAADTRTAMARIAMVGRGSGKNARMTN